MFRVLRQLGMSELLSTDVIESLNDYQVPGLGHVEKILWAHFIFLLTAHCLNAH